MKAPGEDDRCTKIAIRWLLILALASGTSCGCLQIPVETTMLRRASSKTLQLDAVLFSKDGGATTKTAYHIAITAPSSWPNGNQTVFIADKIYGQEKIGIEWSGTDLRIRFPKSSRVFRQVKKYSVAGRTINIDYQLGE